MNKKTIGIVGIGNVGSTLAYSLATSNICNKILLKDIREDYTKAIALDISQAVKSSNGKTKVMASQKSEDFKDCDIVVITAGVARLPNMKREDLLLINSKIMSSILDEIYPLNKNAIFIIVSNPLDAMVYFAQKKLNIPQNKIFGMAGALDSARFKYYISEKLDFEYEKIDAIVIGAHSNTMVPLINSAKVDGKSISDFLDKKDLDEILENTKNGGAKVVELLKTGSAYFAPAYSTFLVCKAILTDSKELFTSCVMLFGEYGYNDIALGVPTVIGKNGVEKVLNIDLSQAEKDELENSSKSVRTSIDILKGVYYETNI